MILAGGEAAQGALVNNAPSSRSSNVLGAAMMAHLTWTNSGGISTDA
jgi:hypothetical protein